jgi:hypothetical protein
MTNHTDTFKVRGNIEVDRPKSWLVKFDPHPDLDLPETAWLPKSQVEYYEHEQNYGLFTVPRWLADEREWTR